MRPEIKTKLCTALRSGQYRQKRGHLYSTDGSFCPLGVLADILIEEKLVDWRWQNFAETDGIVLLLDQQYSGYGTLLPEPNEFIEPSEQDTIIRLSDKEKLSFLQIADYIEENF